MADEFINVKIRLQDAQKFASQMDRSARSVRKLGTETDAADRKARRGATGFGHLRKNIDLTGRASRVGFGHFKRMAGAALGAGAALVSISAARGAVDTTVDLAKTTLALSRNLGLSTEEASRWAAVAKVRGIESKSLNMSFTKLSKATLNAAGGGEQMMNQFKLLGISQEDVKRGSQDFNFLLLRTAKAFGDMKGKPERMAAAQQLLGRGYMTLLPLFAQGEKSLKSQMDLADKYGATFGKTTADKLKNLIAAQREAKFASLGLQVAFGTMVAPLLTKGITAMSHFILQMRQGTGRGGEFRAKLESVYNWLRNNWGAIKRVAVVLGVFWAALKVVKFVQFIQGMWGVRMGAFRLIPQLALLTTALMGVNRWREQGFVKGQWANIKQFSGLDLLASKSNTVANALRKVDGFMGNVRTSASRVAIAAQGAGNTFGIASGGVNQFQRSLEAAGLSAGGLRRELQKIATQSYDNLGRQLDNILPKLREANTTGQSFSSFAAGTQDQTGGYGTAGRPVGGVQRIASPDPLPTFAPIDLSGVGGGGDIHTHVSLNGREIAHAVGRQVEDERARA